VVIVISSLIWLAPSPHVATANLPAQISDSTFWQMVNDFSERGGFFRSDNFVSNEWEFQFVISELKKERAPGGVYIGVGPDQNFTYLVALEPKIAFIVDIRRQNMIQHLMYKALLEMSSDRADFLSRLFSRPRPDDLAVDDSANQLLRAFIETNPDEELFDQNLKAMTDYLTVQHQFKLTSEDLKSLEYVFTAFYEGGPNLTYSFGVGQGANQTFSRSGGGGYRAGGPRGMPSYAQLMMQTDQEGHNRSYLANAENFRILQDLERRNVIIPIVGDFAGANAIREIGRYLKEHDATVTAFYTSNVEQYLFQQSDDWKRFYSNVATLPLDSKVIFIRSVASGRRYLTPGARASLLCPISDLLMSFRTGSLDSYSDVIRMSH